VALSRRCTLLGHISTPADVAYAVTRPLSDTCITGVTLNVAGHIVGDRN
jgi:hypothetical protein